MVRELSRPQHSPSPHPPEPQQFLSHKVDSCEEFPRAPNLDPPSAAARALDG